ncbi:MAG: hypothetical protein LBJ08_05665 [Bifidobacteriaceae bacterium]|nr:hypothetical protein [Bifidobacteriaceae bacterium]
MREPGILAECADLVVPRTCAGCGEPAGGLCQPCRALFAGPVGRREAGAARLVPADGGPALIVWARAAYTGPARTAIAAWKRRGRADLTPVFAQCLAGIGREVAPLAAGLGLTWLAVVPVPSRWVSTLRRGSPLTQALALGCAAGLRERGVEARVDGLLARRMGSRDQVGLGGRARAANREGATLVRRRAIAGSAALLVDDVVTTGASLLDAERALSRAGVGVLGAAVLAATPPSSARR